MNCLHSDTPVIPLLLRGQGSLPHLEDRVDCPSREESQESSSLSKNQSRRSQLLLAFDLDHTLILSNISFLFGKELYRRNLISLPSLFFSLFLWILHLLYCISTKALHRALFNILFRDRKKQEMEEIADALLENILAPSHVEAGVDSPPALLRDSLLKEVASKAAAEKKLSIVILTTSPDFLAQRCIRSMQRYTAHHIWFCKGTVYDVDEEGRFTHVSEVMSGRKKAELVENMMRDRQSADRYESIGYSDSIRDLPFLRAVTHAVCVAPSRFLRIIARFKSWRVIER